VHHFSQSEVYMHYLSNAMRADIFWFKNNTDFPSYVWGSGAGPAPNGYSADNFKSNPYQIASPHIMAGFIPINKNALDDLENMMKNNIGVYQLDNNKSVLWRTSAV